MAASVMTSGSMQMSSGKKMGIDSSIRGTNASFLSDGALESDRGAESGSSVTDCISGELREHASNKGGYNRSRAMVHANSRAPPLVASARLLLVAPLVPPGLCSPRRACPAVRLPRGRDGGMGRAMGSRELARGITLDPAIRKRARSGDLPSERPASGV